MTTASRHFSARLSCPNRPGIVAGIARTLSDNGYDIVDSQQFEDVIARRFFMRVLFDGDRPACMEEVRAMMAPCVARFALDLAIHPRDQPRRVLILVSRADHCLVDLLYRWRTGDLAMEPVGIVSTHPLAAFGALDRGAIPFHHLPADADGARREDRLRTIIATSAAELVVLARYMQIISDGLARELEGRCINIHHSFLPGFKGSRPYHQAYDRGVKMIGATAHYVTPELDEGPIIVQDVGHIGHRDGPDQLVRRGRDIERRVLAEAVRHHLEDRVFINGARTVVFPR